MVQETMRVFVTLFNSRYMSRGLVMYESLCKALSNFKLYIVAFDDVAYRKLTELNLVNVIVIALGEFEDEALLQAKGTRNEREYCWTCSSKSILYVLEKYNETECTYIDADLYFYADPTCLIEEMGEDNAVLITEHRYSDYCNQAETSGKYCVQFVTVRNNDKGMRVLRWWTERCLEWCYARTEDGKFGDQMYLDKFTSMFEGVHELRHLGGGVAPWNVDQYTFFREDGNVMLRRKGVEEKIPVIFFHFHEISFFDKDVVHLAPSFYKIPDTAITCLYKEYIRETERICLKYGLLDNREYWRCEKQFRDDDMDMLAHEKNYYQHSLFI